MDYPCSVDNSVPHFLQYLGLQSFKQKQINENDKICFKCNKTFKSQRILNVHLRKHKTYENYLNMKIPKPKRKLQKKFRCKSCGIVYLSISGYDKHMRKHHRKQTFGDILRNFKTKLILDDYTNNLSCSRKMKRLINGEHVEYFKCIINNCGQIFWHMEQLKNHRSEKHLDSLCQVCFEYSNNEYALLKHLRTRHDIYKGRKLKINIENSEKINESIIKNNQKKAFHSLLPYNNIKENDDNTNNTKQTLNKSYTDKNEVNTVRYYNGNAETEIKSKEPKKLKDEQHIEKDSEQICNNTFNDTINMQKNNGKHCKTIQKIVRKNHIEDNNKFSIQKLEKNDTKSIKINKRIDDKNTFYCIICNKTICGEELYQKHNSFHFKPMGFSSYLTYERLGMLPCIYRCGEPPNELEVMKKHMLQHLTKKDTCQICLSGPYTNLELKQHNCLKHDQIECRFCQTYFLGSELYVKHLKEIHIGNLWEKRVV